MPLNRLPSANENDALPNVFQWGYEERMHICNAIRKELHDLNVANHIVFDTDGGNFCIRALTMDQNISNGENVLLYVHNRDGSDTTVQRVIDEIQRDLKISIPKNGINALWLACGHGIPDNTTLDAPALEPHETLVTAPLCIPRFSGLSNQWMAAMQRKRTQIEKMAEKHGKLYLDTNEQHPWMIHCNHKRTICMDEFYKQVLEGMDLPKNVEVAIGQNTVIGFTASEYDQMFGYAGIEFEPDMQYIEDVRRIACDLAEEYEEVVICICLMPKRTSVQVTIHHTPDPEESGI